MRRYDSNLGNAVLARFELAFLHHALVLLAFAFDAVLIIAFAVRELPNHFIEAAGCVLIR